MFHRRVTALLILPAMLLAFGMRARADYGLESKCPPSAPHQAKNDERPVGTWRTMIGGKIKGSGSTIDDTTENLTGFIESSAAELWGKKVRYARVK